VELVVLADVSAALSEITAGADPPVGEVTPGINYADELNGHD
jgi:hypothetical protein